MIDIDEFQNQRLVVKEMMQPDRKAEVVKAVFEMSKLMLLMCDYLDAITTTGWVSKND